MSGSTSAPDSWVGGNDEWTTGADWSNGTPPDGADATIAPTAPVTVTLEGQQQAGMVDVAAGNALQLANGDLTASAAVLIAGTLNTKYTYGDSVEAPTLTNSGVIAAPVQGTLTLSVTGQLTNLAGGLLSAGYATSTPLEPSTLQVATGTATTFSNAGTITAGQEGVISIVAPFSNTGTVSTTQDGTIRLAGAVSNAGSIVANAGGTLVLVVKQPIGNTGTIAVDGGILELDGNANGASYAAVAASGVAVAAGQQTNADGTTTTVQPTLRFANGTYDNTGATLTLGAFAALEFDNETVNGGTINSNGGITRFGGVTTLNGVTLTGPVAFLPGVGYGSAAVTIVQTSIVLDSASTIASNIILAGNGQTVSLTVGPQGSLVGGGTISPQSTSDFAGVQAFSPASVVNQGLIAGSETLNSLASVDNQGTLDATNGPLTVNSQAFSSEGTLEATSGGKLTVYTALALPAGSIVSAAGGGTVSLEALSSTAAAITATGGTVALGAASGSTWVNTGSIAVGDGGLLQISGGNETIASLGNVVRTGTGSLQIVGASLDLGGQTLGAGNAEFAGLQLGAYLYNGSGSEVSTLAHGTVDQPGLGLVVGGNTAFDAVDITGNLALAAPYGQNAAATLLDGAAVYSDTSKSALGTITIGSGSTVNLLGSSNQASLAAAQTVLLNGGTLTFGTGNGGAVAATIGYGKLIQGSGQINGYTSYFYNPNGTDQVTLTNAGTIEATNGHTININPPLGNLAGGTLTGGTFSAIGRDGYYGGSGAVTIGGGSQPITTLDATVKLRGAGGLGDFGLIVNSSLITGNVDLQNSLTTIGAQGKLVLNTYENFTTANALVNDGTIVLENGGTLTAPTLINNGTLEVDAASS